MNSHSYYVHTFGCQMNERDSETVAGILEQLGLVAADTPEQARVLAVNTCSVREKPEEKVFSLLGQWRMLKRDEPTRIIVVCGCMSQVAGDRIAQRAPYVDIIIGPRNLGHLRDVLAQRLESAERKPVIIADSQELLPEGLPAHRCGDMSAFVNITYGCNNFCAYCIVPFARGPEVSRSTPDILAECRDAVAAGYREITLLGQNVNSYGHDLHPQTDFASLLEQVGKLPDLQRLRFTTSHPKDLSERLLQTMANTATVCEHLHLPIQAGGDHVLAQMGRGYTCRHFISLVERTRELIPDISITTDIMVGFPGENREQFEQTLRAVERIRFDQAFMFKYNDRPGTKASNMPDKIPEDEKQQRLLQLVSLQNRIARDVNRAAVGQIFEVLTEGPDPKAKNCMRGRSRQNKIVVFPGLLDMRGQLVQVRAVEGFLWGHRGELVSRNRS